jgi:hypothetical protein
MLFDLWKGSYRKIVDCKFGEGVTPIAAAILDIIFSLK